MEASEVEEEIPMVSVVAANFCSPSPVELIVKKKYHGILLSTRYQVFDVNGNLLIQVDGSTLRLQKKRVMRDAHGTAILTMREKINLLTLCHRWTVHGGRSSEAKDVIFSAKKCHPLEMTTRLDVHMPSNINEEISSFQLVGSFSDLSCKVFKGNTVIAQVTEGFTERKLYKWKESFKVKVDAGVDYAFIVALLVIATVDDYI